MALIQIGVGPKGPKKAKGSIPKPPFSTGFIRFFDMVECHVRLIYKPNAFLIIFGAILRFCLQNHQNSTGFIRYFHQLFRMLENVVLLMVF